MIVSYHFQIEEQFAGLMNQTPTTETIQCGLDKSSPYNNSKPCRDQL
jgi:hypothetical protein